VTETRTALRMALVAALLGACGDGASARDAGEPIADAGADAAVPVVVWVRIEDPVSCPTSHCVMVGETVQLRATPLGPDGPVDVAVTWFSDSPLVAVDPAGPITGRAAGRAEVVATAIGRDGPVSAAATVEVLPRWLGRIELAPLDIALAAAGDSAAVTARAFDDRGTEVAAELSWRTTNPAVVTAEPGRVVATGPGAARVFVQGAHAAANLLVTVTSVLPPGTGLPATTVAAGQRHTCVLDGGQAFCFGTTYHGVLGDGTAGDGGGEVGFAAVPRRVLGTAHFATVDGGDQHTCALEADGAPWCWGDNRHGQLGVADLALVAEPRAVTTALRFATIAAGARHTCAVRVDTRGGYCWGDNAGGQLGTGGTDDAALPVPVAGEHAWAVIVTGRASSCGLGTDGTAWCWGTNRLGELGTGTLDDSSEPVPVAGGHVFAELAGGAEHTCGRTAAGAVWCWGRGLYGQLGDGAAAASATPVRVAGELALAAVAAGDDHTCALDSDGAAWCWGDGTQGERGDLSVAAASRPVAVAGGLRFAGLAAGGHHTCGITRDGATYCWGGDEVGQLGAGRGGHGSLSVGPWPVAAAAP
jgi:alpha-tubulin suppressor-like RCC1 family protein